MRYVVKLVVTVSSLALLVVAAPTVGAQTSEPAGVACIGTIGLNYSPGLLLHPREVTASSRTILAPCVSTDSSLNTGISERSRTFTTSCLDLNGGASAFGQETFTWNNGQTSTFDYVSTVAMVGGQTVIRRLGTITSGQFAGATAEEVLTHTTVALTDCVFEPGVTRRDGAVELTIGHL